MRGNEAYEEIKDASRETVKSTLFFLQTFVHLVLCFYQLFSAER